MMITTLLTLNKIDLVCDIEDFSKGLLISTRDGRIFTEYGYISNGRALNQSLLAEATQEKKDEAKQKMAEIQARMSGQPVEKIVYVEKESSEPSQPVQPQVVVAPQSELTQRLETAFAEVLATQSVNDLMKEVKPKLDKYIQDTYGVLPQVVKVETPTQTHTFTGAVHEKFETVLKLVSLKIPVFLSGPAGTGKNVIAQQCADALGLKFYFTNAVQQEFQLKGFIDAHGHYNETQFYQAFKNGGLFFLDEMDGSIPETLIILNAAIANGYFDFPIGKVEAHENFRVIAAGNTYGTGADIEYVGRYQLDASSLDRFALLDIDYSPNIENAVTNNNKPLCEFARNWRKICHQSGIKTLFTYRSLDRIAKLENVFDLKETLKMSLTKGTGVDDLQIIYDKFTDKNNKYVKALKELVG